MPDPTPWNDRPASIMFISLASPQRTEPRKKKARPISIAGRRPKQLARPPAQGIIAAEAILERAKREGEQGVSRGWGCVRRSVMRAAERVLLTSKMFR